MEAYVILRACISPLVPLEFEAPPRDAQLTLEHEKRHQQVTSRSPAGHQIETVIVTKAKLHP